MRSRFFSLSAIVLCSVIFVTKGANATSDQQYAYDSCLKRLGKFESRPDYKAMVVGQDDSNVTCFQQYDASDQEAATRVALERCRMRYSRCMVFATSSGVRSWVRKITEMGGEDGSRRSSSSSSGIDDETAAAIVQGVVGVAGAIVGGGGGGGYRPSRTPCHSTSGASCGQR